MRTQIAPPYAVGDREEPHVRDFPERKDEVDDVISGDVKHGLPVIIYARWLLVVAGLGLAIWNAGDDLISLEVTVVLVLVMAVGNFFLHVETARNKPINKVIVYAASVADITAITVVIAMSGVFGSSVYVFYMPALLALSVTFRTRDTFFYTVAAIAAYAAVSAGLIESQEVVSNVPTTMLAHVLVLVAVPACGNVYWRLERDRRTRESQNELLERQVSDQFESLETHTASVKAG